MVPGPILANGANISVFKKWRGNGGRTGLFRVGSGKTEPVSGSFSIKKAKIQGGPTFIKAPIVGVNEVST
jgi:hypothetical protein